MYDISIIVNEMNNVPYTRIRLSRQATRMRIICVQKLIQTL